ncbi:MAG TPA: ribosome assembly RNA-binding protein YhbY [Thermoanaerobaculia bacterium]|nr:ribosome assembly RNA-binding protein YhbY [Thermoanaerobaculia bacterium]
MVALTSKQKQYLKGLAHPLSPIVRIGKGGVSQGVIAETRNALDVHELIKVRIDMEDSSDRKATAEGLAHAADAELVGTLGKIAMLYRERAEEPEIKLPS